MQVKNTATAEFVSPSHPDKICDYIADSILDAYLAGDKESRVAVEVIGGHGLVTVNGEVTSSASPDLEAIVTNIVGADFKVVINISKQSESIAQGVDQGGAGDQGIMKGYATAETATMMPREYELARELCKKVYEKFPYDGKVQVTIEVESEKYKVKSVVVSFQNSKNSELLPLVQEAIQAEEYLINPAGEWTEGGFNADTGLSGRKIAIDAYGPEVPVGGGSFSGKDYTKVDRSGAYMARKIAVDFVKGNAKASPVAGLRPREVFVKLAYAIGKKEPVMAVAVVDGKEVPITGYDLSPLGIRKALNLDSVKYADLAQWGHFGRPGLPWEN